ncbi:MAG: hypothetical protein WCY01_06125 [Alkalispirochaeta sp.]
MKRRADRLHLRQLILWFTLFVCAALPAVPGVAQEADPEWYVSDPEMIRRDPLPGRSPARPASGGMPEILPELEWAVAVTSVSRSAERREEMVRLYHYGSLVSADGTVYSSDGRPQQRRRYDSEDKLLFEETFRYRSDGSLRETRRCSPAGDCTMIRYGRPVEGWDEFIQAPDYRAVHRFDQSGRPEYLRRDNGDGTVEEEWYRYDGPELQEHRVRRDGEERTYWYRDGRITVEEHRRDGRVVQTVTRRFDGTGRILEEVVRGGGTVQRDLWTYDETGRYVMVRTVDNVRKIEESRDPDGSGTTVRYQDGEMVMREHFRNGKATRREIIVDGRVVRTEEL